MANPPPFCGVLDVDTGAMTSASGGHLPGTRSSLRPGDTLMLDTEAFDRAGVWFGEERLLAALARPSGPSARERDQK